MQKTVRLASLEEGNDFYHFGDRYKLSRFNGYFLGIKSNLTVSQFVGLTEVQIDCKPVKIKDIKIGDKFKFSADGNLYYKTELSVDGEVIAIYNNYKIQRVSKYINIYPAD